MAIEFEGDLDVGGACLFQSPQLTHHITEYQLIGRTFVTSLERVMALGWLPAEMAYWSQLIAVAASETKKRLGHNILMDVPEDGPSIALFRAIFEEISPFKITDQTQLARHIFENGNTRVKVILQQDELLHNTTLHRVRGLEAVLSAMVTSTYAALETMATDLWIAAVNRHTQLAKRFAEQSGEKQIPLGVASSYNFDMSKDMGKILYETKKVSFQSFHDIKLAYENAFDETVTDPAFQNHKAVNLAEKIRHVIAHRAGLVDAKFKHDVKDFPDYASLEINKMIPLTGKEVCRHVSACCYLGQTLFNAVDYWSLTNPSAT